MYLNGSDLFNQVIRQSVKSYKARLSCGDEVVENGFSSISIKTGSANNNCYQLGANVSAQLDVVVNDTSTVFTGKWWNLEIGVKTDPDKDYDDVSAYEFIPMGVFKVREQGKSNGKRMFTALDKLSELNAVFEFEGETITSHEAIDIIAIQCNVTIDKTGIANDVINNQSGFTCKDMLGAIAMLNGRSVYADRYGIIVFKKYEHQVTDYTASDTRNFMADERSFSFTCIAGVTGRIIVGENQQSEVRLLPTNADTSGNTLLFYNPFLTQELLDRLYENDIALWTYNVATVPLALGDIRLDPWDVINVYDSDSIEYIIPCMSLVHSYNGGLTTQIQSFGEEQGNTEEGYVSPYKRLQDAITTVLLTVEQLVAQRATIGGFDIDDNGLSTYYDANKELFRINSYGYDGTGLPSIYLIEANSEINGGKVGISSSRILISGSSTIFEEDVNVYSDPNLIGGFSVYAGRSPETGYMPLLDVERLEDDGYSLVDNLPPNIEDYSLESRITPLWIRERGQLLSDKYEKKHNLVVKRSEATNDIISASGQGSSVAVDLFDNGEMVQIVGTVNINTISSAGTYVIANVKKHRPSTTVCLTAQFNNASANIKRAYIDTSGNISIQVDVASSSASAVRLSGFWRVQ